MGVPCDYFKKVHGDTDYLISHFFVNTLISNNSQNTNQGDVYGKMVYVMEVTLKFALNQCPVSSQIIA